MISKAEEAKKLIEEIYDDKTIDIDEKREALEEIRDTADTNIDLMDEEMDDGS